jgi:hypothetical protein
MAKTRLQVLVECCQAGALDRVCQILGSNNTARRGATPLILNAPLPRDELAPIVCPEATPLITLSAAVRSNIQQGPSMRAVEPVLLVVVCADTCPSSESPAIFDAES